MTTTEQTIWVVETETGTLETADQAEARAWNRENVGSSMYRKW